MTRWARAVVSSMWLERLTTNGTLAERLDERGARREREGGVRVLHDEHGDLALGHRLRQGEHVRVAARRRKGRARPEADGPADVPEGVVEEVHGDRGVDAARPAHRHAAADTTRLGAPFDEGLGQVLQLGGGHAALLGDRLDVHRPGDGGEGLEPPWPAGPGPGGPRGRGAAGRARSPPRRRAGSRPTRRRSPRSSSSAARRGSRGRRAPREARAPAGTPPRIPPARSTSRGSPHRATGSSARPRTRTGGSRRSRTTAWLAARRSSCANVS